eukprot:2094492-Amphidinium_carterae.1
MCYCGFARSSRAANLGFAPSCSILAQVSVDSHDNRKPLATRTSMASRAEAGVFPSTWLQVQLGKL